MIDLSDEAKKEIADAIAMVVQDKNSARLRAIHEHLLPPTPETDPPKEGDPSPPPKKGDDEKPPGPKKAGLWGVGYTDES